MGGELAFLDVGSTGNRRGLTSTAILAIAVGFALCRPAMAEPKPGTRIDRSNVAEVADLLPAPVRDWVARGDLTITIGEMRDEAVSHFETALAICVNMRSRPWLARTQYEHARVLLGRDEPGDREAGRRLLATALSTARILGMPLLEERVAELSSRIPDSAHRGSTRPPADSAAIGQPSATNSFQREGEYWTIAHRGTVVRPHRRILRLRAGRRGTDVAALTRRSTDVAAG